MTAFAGTGTLIRFILRRDRVRIPVWIVSILVSLVGTALLLPESFPTQESIVARAQLVENPALKLLLGPGYGIENYDFGSMMSNEMLGIMTIVVALMSIFLVVRHTREEEEVGRTEMVRSSVVGHHAHLTASLLVVGVLNLVIGALVAVGLTFSLAELDFAGSLLFGASLAAVGLVFAGVAAVTVQMNEFARAAKGMAAAVMAVLYLVRGIGDVLESELSWFSPFGWSLHTAPYVLDRWWPLALSVALTAGLVGAAYALSVRRDVGASLVPPSPGSPTAAPYLSKPLGLTLRVQRGSLIGWTIGLLLFGVAIGSVAPEVTDMYADNTMVQDYFEVLGLDQEALLNSVLSLYVMFFGLTASVFSVANITRLRGEETSLRAENLLATAVSRVRWAGEAVVFSLLSSALVLLAAGLSSGIMLSIESSDESNIWMMVQATLTYVPALWLAAGIAVAVFGLFPKAMVLAWFVPVYGFFVLTFGPILGLPEWLYDLSPFDHIPRLPAVGQDIVPLVLMTGLAAALMAAGLYGVRRRDLDFT
jgi:ABC-2 type transport system permease protein